MRVTSTLVAASCAVVAVSGQFDVASLGPMLDRPLSAEIVNAAKQAGPFVKLAAAKIETTACRSKWTSVYDGILERINKGDEVTPRAFLNQVCEIGDQCVKDTFTAIQGYAKSNKFVGKMIEGVLQKFSMSMDTALDGLPLAYYGFCAMFAAEEDKHDEL
mmetsp:Transcript_5471/g.9828  ORF Transcript_5471/g.9828 Transcript_5471/m.9828 type:complete len:160 (+) Transcript_5471:95-574(+)